MAQFVVIAMIVIGILLSVTAVYLKRYWLLLFAAAWLLMPFCISFTYREEALDEEEEEEEEVNEASPPPSPDKENVRPQWEKQEQRP